MNNQLQLPSFKRFNFQLTCKTTIFFTVFAFCFSISNIIYGGNPPALPPGAPPLSMPLPPTAVVGQIFQFPGFDLNGGTNCTTDPSQTCNPFFGPFPAPGQLWQIGICRQQGVWSGSDVVIVRDNITLFDAFTFQLCGNFEPLPEGRIFVVFGANPWGPPGLALEMSIVPGSDPITPIINTTTPVFDGADEASYAFGVVILDDQGMVLDFWDPVIIISNTLQPTGDVNNCPPDCGINSVPTLSQWGLFLLALILFTVSLTAILRRQSFQANANAGNALLTANQPPPLFESAVFLKILPKVLIFVPVVLIVFYLIYGFITIPDVFGTLITAGIVAWLAHYILLTYERN